MVRLIKKRSKTRGLAPGTLVHIGEKKTEKTRITLIDYNSEKVLERELSNIEECFPFKKKSTTTWINIDGLHEIGLIEKIGKHFEIHPLVLEDVLNTDQRPKMEDLEKYIFFVIKMLYADNKTNEIHSEQVSIILGRNFVISFQESIGDVFESVRGRISSGKTRIRSRGADYLAYALIDAIVDNYFLILERIGEKIETMEIDLVSDPSPKTLQDIYNLKREMIYIRKSIWPLREVINNLLRGESRIIKDNTHIYLKDLYDHTIQVIDTIETFRDLISGMLDIYMSSVSNKMNEVMKVLTIFAAIFIPLTFIAGVYGMNFQHMPELSLPWAYPAIWIVIISVGFSLLLYFKHKKWL
jgi:magnesium transporter